MKEIEQATRKNASIRHAERNKVSDCAIFSKSLAIDPNSSVAASFFFPLVQFVDSEKKNENLKKLKFPTIKKFTLWRNL